MWRRRRASSAAVVGCVALPACAGGRGHACMVCPSGVWKPARCWLPLVRDAAARAVVPLAMVAAGRAHALLCAQATIICVNPDQKHDKLRSSNIPPSIAKVDCLPRRTASIFLLHACCALPVCARKQLPCRVLTAMTACWAHWARRRRRQQPRRRVHPPQQAPFGPFKLGVAQPRADPVPHRSAVAVPAARPLLTTSVSQSAPATARHQAALHRATLTPRLRHMCAVTAALRSCLQRLLTGVMPP